MRADQAPTIHRADYRPPSHTVESVMLEFDLIPDATRVQAELLVHRAAHAASDAPITLDGDGCELLELSVDGRRLTTDEYSLDEKGLRIFGTAATCRVRIVTRVNAAANSALSGLYVSNGNFFTQCEAQGFRRITFFPDRPDVMARYRVTLRAERARWPVLLSNGNLLGQGECAQGPDALGIDRTGWHWATWDDPFPKPSYLFAVVAGRLVANESTFMRRSGRPALLQIWVEPGNEGKTAHAMASLERSIRWDEERFGLELDLDRFMIVAVGDFNMGAMENKGLNIFNTRYVFAHPRIATDGDFAGVESVVAHEYFHNWTGNRVTCRDWFQLTLKEGLTVFRDQEFSADMMAAQSRDAAAAASARAVKRIEDVRVLRTVQFAEDAGPMAHPIRPDTYQEINNFYTVTVYEKGAEVIRMLQTLAGREGFRRGMDLYFERHDGQAVTCDDFVAAIADANGLDLAQFGLWYSQAGTPRVRIQRHFDALKGRLHLSVEQSCPATPGQPTKPPFFIPLALGLLGSDGSDLDLVPADDATRAAVLLREAATVTLAVRAARHEFVFEALSAPPVPSVGRGCSAPIIIDMDCSQAELQLLATRDNDPFNRWEAAQSLAVRTVRDIIEGRGAAIAAQALLEVFVRTLADPALDPAFQDLMVTLPSEGFIAEQMDTVDPQALRRARQSLRQTVATALQDRWQPLWRTLDSPSPWSPDLASAGRRALRNTALGYWTETGRPDAIAAALAHADRADNMTDRLAALNALMRVSGEPRARALTAFERDFADEPLVMDKWFTVQAMAHPLAGDPPVLERVRALMTHPAFSVRNPNKVRALITAFCTGNLAEFHRPDGSGYAFWREQVLALDALNPQLAARLARALDRWRKFAPAHRQAMHAALESVAAHPNLSGDVAEIVGKALL